MLAFVTVFYDGMVCFCRMTSLFFCRMFRFAGTVGANFPQDLSSWFCRDLLRFNLCFRYSQFYYSIIFSSSLYHFGLPGVNHWKIHDLGCKFVNEIKVVYLSVFQMIMIAYCTF